MAELPEIKKMTAQMHSILKGKRISTLELRQEKCSNVTEAELKAACEGAAFSNVYSKGKWIFLELDNDYHLLLSPGMGMDAFYFKAGVSAPEKYQIRVLLSSGDGFTVRFWWFGNFLLVKSDELDSEPRTCGIAPDPFDPRFTREYFEELLKGRKTQVKSLILDQRTIGGIGNMYAHDILFRAKLHPKAKVSDTTHAQRDMLYTAIREVLADSIEKGAFAYEADFFGQKGGHTMEDLLVGYKEGQPCPECGTAIEQIKTGQTTTYICPACQRL